MAQQFVHLGKIWNFPDCWWRESQPYCICSAPKPPFSIFIQWTGSCTTVRLKYPGDTQFTNFHEIRRAKNNFQTVKVEVPREIGNKKMIVVYFQLFPKWFCRCF
jgi:hypothetical protein